MGLEVMARRFQIAEGFGKLFRCCRQSFVNPGLTSGLAIEAGEQGHRRTERKCPALQRLMNCAEAAQPATGEVVECPAINRSGEGLAPMKQRLGVNAQGRFVKLGLAVNIAPSDRTS